MSVKEDHTPWQYIVVVNNVTQVDLVLGQLCNRELAFLRGLYPTIASLPLFAGILNEEPGSTGLRTLYW